MAYIGYTDGMRARPGQVQPRQGRAKLAWGRLAVVAASALAWVGVIASAHAIF